MNKSLLSLLSLAALIALVSAEYPTPGSDAWINDNNVLQYALTLENLEYTFYTQGLAMFNTAASFAGYPVPQATLFAYLGIIRDHEASHVASLSALLMSRGVVPVKPCNYTFNFFNSTTFLATAQLLENTGVKAYDGAIQSLTQTNLVTLAASVATVEARHAAFLNLVNAAIPYPNVTDLTLPSNVVLGVVGSALINGPCIDFQNVQAIGLFPAVNFRNYTYTPPNQVNLTAAYLNDNNALNYALTLERLENTFYSRATTAITPATFAMIGVDSPTLMLIQLIAAQEASHVSSLTALITSRNGSPVGDCTSGYTFSFNDNTTSAATFLVGAAALEGAGVSAYLGAAAFFTDETLLGLAATVVTVEARHASFLNSLTSMLNLASMVPFPNVTDIPLQPTQIVGAAAPFLNFGACPQFVLPVLADNFRPNNTGTPTGTGTGSGSGTGTGSASGTATTGSSSASATGTGTGSATGTGTGSGTASVTGTSSRSTSPSTSASTSTRSSTSTSSTNSNSASTRTTTANNSDASGLALSLLFTVCALAAIIM